MEKQVILSALRDLKASHFEECVTGDILGTLTYQDYIFRVRLQRDAVGKYICLEYTLSDVKDLEDSTESIDERVIAGRYSREGNNLVLKSFFPIFEEKFVEQQMNNAICVIEQMIHICKH